MPKSSKASQELPDAVRKHLQQLGSRVRTARMRRRMPLRQLADRTGLTVPTLIRIEGGYPGTGIGAYATVLWILGLADGLTDLAAQEKDTVGLALEAARSPARARAGTHLDDDF